MSWAFLNKSFKGSWRWFKIKWMPARRKKNEKAAFALFSFRSSYVKWHKMKGVLWMFTLWGKRRPNTRMPMNRMIRRLRLMNHSIAFYSVVNTYLVSIIFTKKTSNIHRYMCVMKFTKQRKIETYNRPNYN